MVVLAIGAHPDDIEYGCGGSLLKHKFLHNHKVYLLVITRGEMSGGAEVRTREQEDAARFLKADGLFWGGFKDTEIPEGKPLIEKIDEIISKVKPDLIYVNYPDDAHQDHRAVANATIAACRYSKRVLFYEDYTTRNFEPNVFVDIADVLDKKIELLKIHRSQVEKPYPTGLDMLESVHSIASFRGFQGKVKYAEGFVALRYLLPI